MVVNHDQPTLDQLQVCFDDHHAVANAGLLLPATLAERLGIQAATDELVRLGGSAGAHAGQAADRGPRHARLRRLHRRPRRAALRCLPPARSWAIGSWPPRPWGRSCARSPTLGYHPLLPPARAPARSSTPACAPAAPTPPAACPASSTSSSPALAALAPPASSPSGQTPAWSAKAIKCLRRHGVRYSITVRQTKPVRHAIAQIPEPAWTDICYPDTGVAQVAETRLKGDRLIVRRVRHLQAQAELFPTWQYDAFVTDQPGTAIWLDTDHRRHATVELAIRDLKNGAGLNLPLRAVRRQRRLGAGSHAGAQPCALDRHPRARRPRRAALRQDRAADPAWDAGPADPLRAPLSCTCPTGGHGRTRSRLRWPGCAASRSAA